MDIFERPTKRQLGEVVFDTAMYWRIGYGALRVFVGYKLLEFVGMPAIDVYQRFTQREFTEDPSDKILQFIGHTLEHHGFPITYFLAAHFLFWGTIDIVLSYAMLRHHLWAFLTGIFFIIIFMVYEIYRFAHTHSLILFAFICMDVFFVIVIRNEYLKLKRRVTRISA